MVVRLAVALVLLASAVRADPAEGDHDDKLAQARAAIDQVRYTQAQPLLVEALEQGTSAPATVIELYRLLASTATVLGQKDTAELYYRRWLALEPGAKLPEDVAPKLRDPFVAAQVYMAARARLAASARLQAGSVEIYLESDPLAMVAAVAIDAGAPHKLGVDRRARIAVAPAHQRPDAAHAAQVTVALLDEFGNHLLELPASGDDGPSSALPAPQQPASRESSGSLVRNPLTWGVGGASFAAVGVGFGLAARQAQSSLDDIIAHGSQHFYSDAQAAKSQRDRDAVVADLAFVAGGACVATAIVMYAIRPSRTVVVPSASGVALAVTW